MSKKFLLFLFFILLPLSLALKAQEKDTLDTWESEDEEEDYPCYFHSGDWNLGFNGNPTIEATYGISKAGLKSTSVSFGNLGSAELRLSYSHQYTLDRDYLISYRNRFALFTNNSADLTSQGTGKDVMAELWRFGFGYQSGYGYKFASSAVIPYSSNSFVWTRLNIKSLKDPAYYTPSAYSSQDAETMLLFNESFRFGTMTEAGIKVQIVPVFTLNASYERAVVFPRYLFWKHAGSMIIEWAGQGMIDTFVNEIMHSSPAAGPIVNFVLKNGFSYALYQLRSEKMNWPFNSASPFTSDTWRAGLTFTF
ncbi:MAG: hypothetical protein ACM3RX_01225 [Methanococcaceae archaeon]